jgi:hypothetical protein
MVISVGSLGALSGDWVMVHMSSGGETSGSSRMPGHGVLVMPAE